MTGITRGCVAGGIATAKKLRDEAKTRYEINPSICKFCGSTIPLGSQRPCAVKKKLFCNRSCSASFNNPRKKKKAPPTCSKCGARVSRRSVFCVKCAPRTSKRRTLDLVTKGEVFEKAKYWVQGAAILRKHARRAYLESGGPLVCKVCTYSLHVDVAHIRDVSDFPLDATVEEINAIENLVALCKNHHWEFDNGHLTLQPIEIH